MRTETILDAMVKAELDRTDVRKRQIAAFRARILRMDAEKDLEIASLAVMCLAGEIYEQIINKKDARIDEYRRKVIEKDDRIEHLENDLSQCVQWKDKQIADLVQGVAEYRKEIIEKDEEIRVLEAEIDIRDKALDDSQVDLEMWRE